MAIVDFFSFSATGEASKTIYVVPLYETIELNDIEEECKICLENVPNLLDHVEEEHTRLLVYFFNKVF